MPVGVTALKADTDSDTDPDPECPWFQFVKTYGLKSTPERRSLLVSHGQRPWFERLIKPLEL
jgi:hypothetical protein